MTISNANIVTCPYCGAKKELMSLNSSNNIGAQYWSDLKTIAPMDPKISPVQKCHNCGKYYLEHKQEATKGDMESWETGELSYWEWKDAYLQFCIELGNSISPKDMLNVQGWLLQAYNDYFYRRGGISTPSVEEQEFIANVIKKLIETIDWGETTDTLFPGGVSFDPPEREKQVWSMKLNPIFKAELYREIGDFQKCDELIQSFSRKQMHSFDAHLCYCIKEHMKQRRKAVLKFYDEQRDDADYSPKQEQSIQSIKDVNAFPTMYKCPNCGNFSPGPDKCIHCSADLHSSANSRANVHQEGSRFKLCSNGHYYSVNLEYCPYCGGQSVTAKPFSQEEHRRFSSEYIVDGKGHYYMLNSDGKTASFVCWSKAAWNVYLDYMRFYDWFIECTADDVQEAKHQEEYFDTVRIKHQSEMFKIPREIVWNDRTYPVVRIRSGAFSFSEINSIAIPDTMMYIEERAFFRCDGIRQLQIPDNVDLANRAIFQCKDLVNITWRGITYEDDIDELFIFPDHKDKYAIIVSNIPRCHH